MRLQWAQEWIMRKVIVLFLRLTIVGTRLFLIFYFPLTDTTEARYTNTALIMTKTKLVRIANRTTALWSIVIYMSLLLSFGL